MPEQPGSAGTSSRPIDLVAAALVLTQTVDELPGNIAKASIGENGDIQFLSEFDDFSNDELITQLSGDQETLIGGHAVVSGSQKDLTRWHLGNGFLVGIQSTNEPVAAGDDLTVDVKIKNVSAGSATKDVALDVANAERDRKSVSLNKGASTTVSLTWSTQSGDGGDYTATVSSPDDTDSQTVTVGASVRLFRYEFEQNVTDSWNNYDGTDNTSAGYSTTAAVGSYSKDFDGVDDTVTSGYTQPDQTAFSLSSWVNISSWNTDSQNIITNFSTSTTAYTAIQRDASNNQLKMTVQDQSGTFASWTDITDIADGNWHHVVLTYSNGTVEFYLDGSSVGDVSGTLGTLGNGDPYVIGGDVDGNNLWAGLIDDVRGYDKELSASEVSNLYNNDSI